MRVDKFSLHKWDFYRLQKNVQPSEEALDEYNAISDILYLAFPNKDFKWRATCNKSGNLSAIALEYEFEQWEVSATLLKENDTILDFEIEYWKKKVHGARWIHNDQRGNINSDLQGISFRAMAKKIAPWKDEDIEDDRTEEFLPDEY